MRTLVLTLLLPAVLQAQATPGHLQLSLQGRLEDSGTPLTGATTATARLFAQESGGSPLFSEAVVLVPDALGVFEVSLGGTAAVTAVDFAQPLWAEVELGGGSVLAPRLPLRAAPTAHYARAAGVLRPTGPISMASQPLTDLVTPTASKDAVPKDYVDQRFDRRRVAFHASASTDQTVADTAYSWLRLNNDSSGENFDFGDHFTSSTGTTFGDYGFFTAPVDGVYFLEAAALWDNTSLAEARNAIFLWVNDTDEVGEWEVSGGSDFFGVGISSTLELSAGDEVSVRLYNGDSSPMDTFSQSGKYCYFSGFLVFPTSDP